MRQFVQSHSKDFPQLLDLVAADASVHVDNESNVPIYSEHLPMHEIMSGLRSKRLLKGVIRVKRDGVFECYVVVHSDEDQIRQSVNVTGRLLKANKFEFLIDC